MKSKWIVAVVLGVALLGASTIVLAQDAAGEGVAGRLGRRVLKQVFGRLGELRGELALTPEQKLQIAVVLKEHKAEIVKQVKAVRDKGRALRAATEVEPINEKAIRAAADELGDALGDGAVLRAKIRAEIRPILTEEQRNKIDRAKDDVKDIVDKAIEEAEKE